MKRFLSLLTIAAAMMAFSCTKIQDFEPINGDEASIHFSVESSMLTKANSDFATGTKVDALAVQAFIKDGDGNFQLTNAVITVTPQSGSSPLAWDVDMRLAKGREYKIAFFAYKNGTGIYDITNLSSVTVDYSKIAVNSDNADAFCAARNLVVSNSLSETVYLYRPLAQINVGVSDWDEYKKSTLAEMQDITVAIAVNSVPNTLNIIGGAADAQGVVPATVSGTGNISFEEVAVLNVDDELTTGYDYFSMVYVLAAKDKETMTFTADFNYGTAHTDIFAVEVSNLPYQANYRTNILGQFLTGNLHYDVEIVPGFNTPDFNKHIEPSYDDVASLNAYFATMQDGTGDGDNGDVVPEAVILKSAADGDIINLPVIAGNVQIRFEGSCDGTLNIVYGDTSDGAKKPANIFFYASSLATLNANVPASHFELMENSKITTKIIAATNSTTFVVRHSASAPELELARGKAEIAGKVTKITVPAGATLDGTNPVAILIGANAEVAQVELGAAAALVAEQPAAVDVAVKADGCSVTVQNGGNANVSVDGGVKDCSIASNGSESVVAIVEVGDGAEVEVSGEGQIEYGEGVEDKIGGGSGQEEEQPEVTYGWLLTALSDITDEDVFVIVSSDDVNEYAMSNDGGSSNAPSAVEVTVEDDEITSEVADNIKWNLAISEEKIIFYPNGTTESWLYSTTSNNGLRVGTGVNKLYSIDSNYLYNNDTGRYIGVYNGQDWRNYTTINSNITGQTLKFFVYAAKPQE